MFHNCLRDKCRKHRKMQLLTAPCRFSLKHDVFLDSVAAPIFPSSLGHSTVNSPGWKQGGSLWCSWFRCGFFWVTLMKHALEQPSSKIWWGCMGWRPSWVYIFFPPQFSWLTSDKISRIHEMLGRVNVPVMPLVTSGCWCIRHILCSSFLRPLPMEPLRNEASMFW